VTVKTLPVLPLEAIRIASPCDVPWSAMQGDDRQRHCGQCDRAVYDLSSLSRDDAEALVGARAASGERLCVTFFVRRDGTVLTADCPVGLAAVRRRLAWIAAGVGALLAVAAGVIGLRRGTDDGRARGWFSPRPVGRVMGEMVAMPAAPPPALPVAPITSADDAPDMAATGE